MRPNGARWSEGARLAPLALVLAACSGRFGAPVSEEATSPPVEEKKQVEEKKEMATSPEESAASPKPPKSTAIATFGAGCFWCVEAVLEQLEGVVDVKSGYMGGSVPTPTYDDVCSGRTGHAEVVQVTFDPERISYGKLLDFFWELHDPTTLNRQGNDVGTQYRSAIFYHSEEQRQAAEASKKALEARGTYRGRVVTEITQAGTFYEAEDHHQDYYRLNRRQPYCRYIIAPKLDKLGLEK
jgi:peptide-methionine (S)-S-oxide reductase